MRATSISGRQLSLASAALVLLLAINYATAQQNQQKSGGLLSTLLGTNNNNNNQAQNQNNQQSSSAAASAAASNNGSGGASSAGSSAASGGGDSASSAAAASATSSTGQFGSQSPTPAPEGLLDKVKQILASKKQDPPQNNAGGSSSAASSAASSSWAPPTSSGGGEGGASSASSSAASSGGQQNQPNQQKSEGVIGKLEKLVQAGTEAVKDKINKIEDKVANGTEKISSVLDEHVVKPMASTSGSGSLTQEGQTGPKQEPYSQQQRGPEREKHLLETKKKQESELGKQLGVKELINQAKANGVIPANGEDPNKTNGQKEKGVALEMFDKAHEMSKLPVETLMRPIDKMLGYEKDPLLRLYDSSHEVLRKPLELVSKPVNSLLEGAFKTSEESKQTDNKILATKSEQERAEIKQREQKERSENRSVFGTIADKSFALASKPIELALKPLDHALGLDKNGGKNPLLKLLEEFYSLSKKPLDAIAKPLEKILKKMATDGAEVEVSVKVGAASSAGGASSSASAATSVSQDDNDPKIFTRMADGALNIAGRLVRKPMELIMKPLNHALGFDDPGKKNPILEAAQQLKNASRVGVELWTRPVDRIIKEIAEIGDPNKSDAQRRQEFEEQKADASRLVKVLDKIHKALQAPYQVVVKPVNQAVGVSSDGRDPILDTWDLIHQILRTPVQVISKPVEDVLIGPQQGQQQNKKQKIKAKVEVSSGQQQQQQKTHNIFVDRLRNAEHMASRPFVVITSPIRRLILGDDQGKQSSGSKAQSSANAKAGSAQANAKAGSVNTDQSEKDKIMRTLENINNLALKPLEILTQPLSDIITGHKKSQGNKQQQQQGQNQGQNQGHNQKSDVNNPLAALASLAKSELVKLAGGNSSSSGSSSSSSSSPSSSSSSAAAASSSNSSGSSGSSSAASSTSSSGGSSSAAASAKLQVKKS